MKGQDADDVGGGLAGTAALDERGVVCVGCGEDVNAGLRGTMMNACQIMHLAKSPNLHKTPPLTSINIHTRPIIAILHLVIPPVNCRDRDHRRGIPRPELARFVVLVSRGSDNGDPLFHHFTRRAFQAGEMRSGDSRADDRFCPTARPCAACWR